MLKYRDSMVYSSLRSQRRLLGWYPLLNNFAYTHGRHAVIRLLSCQPRVTVTTFVYKVIRDLESIDHLFINPICRIGLIHKRALDSRLYTLVFYFTICKQNISSLSLLVGTTERIGKSIYTRNDKQYTGSDNICIY